MEPPLPPLASPVVLQSCESLQYKVSSGGSPLHRCFPARLQIVVLLQETIVCPGLEVLLLIDGTIVPVRQKTAGGCRCVRSACAPTVEVISRSSGLGATGSRPCSFRLGQARQQTSQEFHAPGLEYEQLLSFETTHTQLGQLVKVTADLVTEGCIGGRA